MPLRPRQPRTAIVLALLGAFPTAAAPEPVDPQATAETRALLANLSEISRQGILIGHHDTTAYGAKWQGGANRSDIHDITGDFPALYGWDFMHIRPRQPSEWEMQRLFAMGQRIQQAHAAGAVNTICWHMRNPVTDQKYDDTTRAVARILPGGDTHHRYTAMLDRAAAFANALKSTNGTPIPIIFRPFHEHNGDWFWWGAAHCSPDEFIALWRFTVSYLRDTRGVHTFLYAYSPDLFRNRSDYLARYPGDAFVDILGLDNYRSVTSATHRHQTIGTLRTIVRLARHKHKLAAFTETGQDRIPTRDWFTRLLLEPIDRDPELRSGIAYLMLWRNDSPAHHYAPFPHHAAVADFRAFHAHPLTLFQADLPDLYHTAARGPAPRRAAWLRSALYASVEQLHHRRKLPAWTRGDDEPEHAALFAAFHRWADPFDPVRENARPVDATLIPAGGYQGPAVIPAEDSDWRAQAPHPVVAIDRNGRTDGDRLPGYIHPKPHAGRTATLTLNTAERVPLLLTIHVDDVAENGAVLRAQCDGLPPLEQQLSLPDETPRTAAAIQRHNGDCRILLPPGRRTLRITNSGRDWFRIAHCTVVVPSPQAIVRGVTGDRQTLLFLRNTTFTGTAGPDPVPIRDAALEIRHLPLGTWRVEPWDIDAGKPAAATIAEVTADGRLRIPLPTVNDLLAIRLRKP